MGTRRSWAIAFAAIAITAFVIGAVMWRASAPPRRLGRHAIYITDVYDRGDDALAFRPG